VENFLLIGNSAQNHKHLKILNELGHKAKISSFRTIDWHCIHSYQNIVLATRFDQMQRAFEMMPDSYDGKIFCEKPFYPSKTKKHFMLERTDILFERRYSNVAYFIKENLSTIRKIEIVFSDNWKEKLIRPGCKKEFDWLDIFFPHVLDLIFYFNKIEGWSMNIERYRGRISGNVLFSCFERDIKLTFSPFSEARTEFNLFKPKERKRIIGFEYIEQEHKKYTVDAKTENMRKMWGSIINGEYHTDLINEKSKYKFLHELRGY